VNEKVILAVSTVETLQHHVDISTYAYERTMIMEHRSAMLRTDGDAIIQTVRDDDT